MNVINVTEKNRQEAIEKIIALGGEGIVRCIQCGACISVCPLARTGFTLNCKKLIRLIQTGHWEEMIEDPSTWACVACNRCTEVCPRDVRPSEIIFAYRRFQAMELAISTSATMSQMNLYMKGHAVFSEAGELRQKVGLDPVPPTTLADEKALREVQTLLENSPMAELGLF